MMGDLMDSSKPYHNSVKELVMRLPILLAILVLGSIQAMGEQLITLTSDWVGRSGPQTVFNRCTDLAGDFEVRGGGTGNLALAAGPNGNGKFIYAAEGHSAAIDNACREMHTIQAFHCLKRIRHAQMVAGSAERQHDSNPGKAHRNFHELSPDVVINCARF
jgi:hypothetical protein